MSLLNHGFIKVYGKYSFNTVSRHLIYYKNSEKLDTYKNRPLTRGVRFKIWPFCPVLLPLYPFVQGT